MSRKWVRVRRGVGRTKLRNNKLRQHLFCHAHRLPVHHDGRLDRHALLGKNIFSFGKIILSLISFILFYSWIQISVNRIRNLSGENLTFPFVSYMIYANKCLLNGNKSLIASWQKFDGNVNIHDQNAIIFNAWLSRDVEVESYSRYYDLNMSYFVTNGAWLKQLIAATLQFSHKVKAT